MIKVTCPCGGTYEVDTVYRESDDKQASAWLVLHQACVNEQVLKQAIKNKKASTFVALHDDNDLMFPNVEPLDLTLLRRAVDDYAIKNDLSTCLPEHWAVMALKFLAGRES